MKICVAGWYFRPDWLDAVKGSGYQSFVVKHRDGDDRGIPSAKYPNVGLEFGAYRQYVENHWDGASDVFFCHDDARIVVDGNRAFEDIARLGEMGVQHAYIFQDEMHEYVNGGAHGRGMWMSSDTILKLACDFPADMDNGGINVGVKAQAGVLKFHEKVTQCGPDTAVIAIVPQIAFAHRGRLHESMFVYRKVNRVPGGIVNVA